MIRPPELDLDSIGDIISDGAVLTVNGESGPAVTIDAADVGAQPLDATLTALAGVTTAADKVIYATGVDTFTTTDLTSFGRTLIASVSNTTARTALGLVIGTDVQAFDAELAALAGLTSAADRLPYFTGSGTASLAVFTSAARDLLDDADAGAMRTTLALVIGANVQAWDADLDGVAGLAGNGLTARTGVGTWATRSLAQPAAGFTISNPDGVSGNPTFTLTDDLAALEALGTTGLTARTGTATWVNRSLTQPAAGITISNPDGVSGSPTFALANDLSALEGLGSTGIAVRSAADTWVQRSIAQPAAGITISNPDGVSGNPTLALANDLSAVEGLSGTGYARRTGTDTWTTTTNPTGVLLGMQVKTSGTSYTPTSGTASIIVEAVGGGGGGGGTTSAAVSGAAGGGGAGGAVVLKRYTGIGAGPYTYAIAGGGGGGNTSGGNGGAGGNTTFTDGVTLITAKGGGGGQGMTANTTVSFVDGGNGVVGTNGDVNGCGAPGMYGQRATGLLGAAGSGGSSPYGGGGGVKTGAGTGFGGTGYGAGGGGGLVLNGSTAVGGGGGTGGILIIYEYA